MESTVFRNYKELSLKTAQMIIECVNKKPDALLCLAAGHTSLGTFKYLIDFSKQGKVSFENVRFVGLDEWTGLGRGDDGSCIGFMYKNLFEPLGIDDSQIVFYDGKAQDLDAECKRIDKYVLDFGPIDFMLLGMGMNGHLGLNEPGTSFDHYSHIVQLDDVTKRVGQKYFNKQTAINGGITMGMKHIKDAANVVLIVNGSKKAEMVEKLIKSEVTSEIPASFLKTIDSACLFVDRDAAAYIK